MKSTEFLAEASTLRDLGVADELIGPIHKGVHLYHDAEFEPIKSKAEAKALLKKGHVVAFVRPDGEAYVLGYYDHPMSSTGVEVKMVGPDGRDIKSVSKAVASIKGRGFKMYASVSSAANKGRSQTRTGYDYGAPFLKKAKVLDPAIKKRAQEGYQKVRQHVMDLVDRDEPGDKYKGTDIGKSKEYLQLLKSIAENGISAFQQYPGERAGGGGTYAMKRFFKVPYEYYLDNTIEEFEGNEKLAVHKFVKFVLQHIDNFVEQATTGGYKKSPTDAGEYEKKKGKEWKSAWELQQGQ